MIERARIVSHPGIYIKEAIEELGLNQSEFALRSGLSIKNVSTLISGESNITFEVAQKLSSFFNNSVEGWINLQTKYDLYKAAEEKEREYEEDWLIAKQFDKDFMNDCLKIHIDSKNKEETIDQLRRRFCVGSLTALKQNNMYVFYKTSVSKDIDEKTIIMRNAWVSLAEQQARQMRCQTFNKDKLLDNIKYLKRLTLEDPEVFQPKLIGCLAECGIKLIILPFLPHSNVTGVTKWLPNDSGVMIAVNDCGKDADKIWFAIFHEIGHAIKNHKRHLTISYKKGEIETDEEKEANEFAKNSFIDPQDYKEFIENRDFRIGSIKAFAKKQNIAYFMVIGRLQKEGLLPWTAFQDYKVKYNVIL